MESQEIASTLIAMEIAALELWNQGNPSGYLEIYAPDITYFDPFQEHGLEGQAVRDLYERLRGLGKVDSYEMINPVVDVFPRSAVLTFNLDSRAGDEVYKWNCTSVYAQDENDRWTIRHHHWSLVKPGA